MARHFIFKNKKIIQNTPVILLASARKNSDTEKYVDIIFRDIEHTKIDLLDYVISPYDYSHNYSSGDNFIEITEQLLQYDKIIFATPVYWYSMSGLMKTFFDRFTDLVTIQKQTGRKLAGKETSLFEGHFRIFTYEIHRLFLFFNKTYQRKFND